MVCCGDSRHRKSQSSQSPMDKIISIGESLALERASSVGIATCTGWHVPVNSASAS